jgi:hypothetical protein
LEVPYKHGRWLPSRHGNNCTIAATLYLLHSVYCITAFIVVAKENYDCTRESCAISEWSFAFQHHLLHLRMRGGYTSEKRAMVDVEGYFNSRVWAAALLSGAIPGWCTCSLAHKAFTVRNLALRAARQLRRPPTVFTEISAAGIEECASFRVAEDEETRAEAAPAPVSINTL